MPYLPFGPPDGAQPDDFPTVSLYEEQLELLVGMRRSRLVVSRVGAGKSSFLRLARARFLADEHFRVATEIQREHPASVELVTVSERWPNASVSAEVWAAVWKAAILRSYISHALCHEDLRQFDDFDGISFRVLWSRLLGETASCHSPRSVFADIRDIISGAGREEEFWRYLRDDDWSDLINSLASQLQDSGPVCMFIDLDDAMTSDLPGPSLTCQRGLLRAVHALNNGPLAGLLIVVATSRETHYVGLLARDASPTFRDDLLLLELDEQGIEKYMNDMLDVVDRFNGNSTTPMGLRRFILNPTICNIERRIAEPALAYVLRHTRHTPRDVVVVGNEFALRQRRHKDSLPLEDREVRSVVRGAARLFGKELISTCVLYLASEMSAEDTVAEYLISTYATPGGYDSPTLRVRLENIIRTIGVDRVDHERVERARAQTTGEFAFDIADALWRSGLLGYGSPEFETGRYAFFALGVSGTELPRSDRYAFHPCLIDALMLNHRGAEDVPTTPIADPA